MCLWGKCKNSEVLFEKVQTVAVFIDKGMNMN